MLSDQSIGENETLSEQEVIYQKGMEYNEYSGNKNYIRTKANAGM